jgi:hypothetical protein
LEIGKLYTSGNEYIVDVSLRFHDSSEASWWGELVPMEYKPISNGDAYVIELKDGRRGRCSLRKLVNRAVVGVPPLYHYGFRGSGRME